MRVLLVVPPSRARLHTLVPLGWALRTGGHAVQVAGPAAEVTGAGFVAVEHPDESDVDELVGYAALWRPELVVWDASTRGAEVARAVGAEDLRVSGPHDALGEGGAGLDLLPPSLRAGGTPVRFTHYTGPAVLPAWLRRGVRRRRVFVAAGVAAEAVAGLCEAVRGMDVELICLAGIPEGTRIPSNARVFAELPVAPVLATCAAVVHDGEPSLALAAAAHGMPQLAVGGGALAGRIAAAGAGVLAGTVDKLVLDQLVNDPAHAAAAARLGAEIAALPAPRDVVADLGSRRAG